MKKILLIILGILFLVGVANAVECGNENKINLDCNIYVITSSDTTSCDINIYNPDESSLLSNESMENSAKRYFSQVITPISSGDYVYTIKCYGDINVYTGGSFRIVDNNSFQYFSDINSAILDQNLSVDYNAIWNWNGDIGTNILQQIADAIWGLDPFVTIYRFINGIIP